MIRSGAPVPAFPPTFWDLVDQRSSASPHTVLVEDDKGRTLTAVELRDAAERVAAGLTGLGVGRDTVVGWQLPTTVEAVVLMCALARLGAVQVPIIPILRRREVAFIAAETATELLITPAVWRGFDYAAMAADIADEIGFRVLTLTEAGLPEGDPATLPRPPRPESAQGQGQGQGQEPAQAPVRFIYYSSGTTADPKGGRHTDASAMASASGIIVNMAVEPDDCIPIPFPFTHIGGIVFMVTALWTGCRVLLVEIFDPVTSPVVMGQRGSTLVGSAVPFYRAYIDAQHRLGDVPLFPRLRTFIGGGAPKPPEIHAELRDLFGVPGIVAGWGLTECAIATCASIDDSDEELATTEGRPSPGVAINVVDRAGHEVPDGTEGELRLKGPQMITGYVDKRLDAAAFDELGYLRTGDLGVIGPRGHVRITGRLKDVIIRNAENISVQEVEDVLYSHPMIEDVAVIGLPDGRTGERACAVIVLADGENTVTLDDVAAHCRSHHLATQKIPEQLEVVDAIPRNSLGKILKQQLRETYAR